MSGVAVPRSGRRARGFHLQPVLPAITILNQEQSFQFGGWEGRKEETGGIIIIIINIFWGRKGGGNLTYVLVP